jgi:DNA-binding response OmpR family regulator
MRILVVEDDAVLLRTLTKGLQSEQYIVDTADTGTEGQELAEINDYDLIVLDRGLPGKNGLSVCRELRDGQCLTPILMLTALNELQDRIEGLDAGADDYLAKPFAFDEFLARVRALLRRQTSTKSGTLVVADLQLDPASLTVIRAGASIHLTQREYRLLEYLMRHAGDVVSRSVLTEHVWENYDSLDSNIVDVYINYLRQKIDKGHAVKLIQTIRGAGYSLRLPNDSTATKGAGIC